MAFHEGGKVENATPIKNFSHYEKMLKKFWGNFDGSGITPSYFPSLTERQFWSYPSFHYITLTQITGFWGTKNYRTYLNFVKYLQRDFQEIFFAF